MAVRKTIVTNGCRELTKCNTQQYALIIQARRMTAIIKQSHLFLIHQQHPIVN